MNVLFVSQCSKRALTETRRILDQFAERCGERTWQTPITQAGLETVHKLLRQSARKNTAVACRWIHGQGHSELLVHLQHQLGRLLQIGGHDGKALARRARQPFAHGGKHYEIGRASCRERV